MKIATKKRKGPEEILKGPYSRQVAMAPGKQNLG